MASNSTKRSFPHLPPHLQRSNAALNAGHTAGVIRDTKRVCKTRIANLLFRTNGDNCFLKNEKFNGAMVRALLPMKSIA
ncbi:hypothetical protein PC116_g26857 [Phytophthora cactorum]|uniref:Uncharacterized protein n=1 Tax=Phytophthora cactorum TaxID=29920 RepID=A0A8T1JLV2_9STRA|nr:hypothetical protein PC117_g24939 [Phytophthora cactorum]KAG2966357.1 hypothetical protein PC119_g24734 [Phytophthora cactorum]KAG4224697.1 hypothetical protein PC116_g26857 [Phytophthora cactorum]